MNFVVKVCKTLTLSGVAHLLEALPELHGVGEPEVLRLRVRVGRVAGRALEQDGVGGDLQVPGPGDDQVLLGCGRAGVVLLLLGRTALQALRVGVAAAGGRLLGVAGWRRLEVMKSFH